MARLYANENFPLPVVEALRRMGHNVLTTGDTGKGGQSIADEQVLELAIADDRAVLTYNRTHFIRLHRVRPDHVGIIACTVDSDFNALAIRIHDAIDAMPELRGQLVRITRPA